MGGGIMQVAPRQGALLGGLKKAVKGVAKGIGSFLKSDLGKAALLGVGAFGLPKIGTFFQGMPGLLTGNVPQLGLKELLTKKAADVTLGDTLKVGAMGTVLGGVLSALDPQEEEEIVQKRNLGALKSKLTQAYQNLGYDEAEIPGLVANDMSEYTQDMSRGVMAEGGRIGYAEGNPDQKQMAMVEDMLKRGMDMDTIKTLTGASDEVIQDRINFIKYGGAKVPIEKAEGGRIGYAKGDTAEQNAMQASGIMDLPLNQNPAGITELDLRESGGFIPPVGVKEKADDIPAMLSNNEFVFTADAVRGMGDGNVNLGAQRMYDMMKKLENGGRV
jgi:hypothetical protein